MLAEGVVLRGDLDKGKDLDAGSHVCDVVESDLLPEQRLEAVCSKARGGLRQLGSAKDGDELRECDRTTYLASPSRPSTCERGPLHAVEPSWRPP